MDKLYDISSIIGGLLLALTLVWVGTYNIKQKQTRKGSLFILAGIILGIIVVRELLFPHLPGLL